MERKFEEDLEYLKKQLLDMATKVECNIGDAIAALRNRDMTGLNSVVNRDAEVDMAEIQIDDHCLAVLALQQPVARDLRFITTALKIVKDLERVGDIAANIAQHGIEIINDERASVTPELSRMAALAQAMLKRALDAFVRRDSMLARTVIGEDDQVDAMHRSNVRQFVEQMAADPAKIAPLTHMMSISKFFERIGDHSSNISEMVVFLVEGKDIRHLEKIRRFEALG